MSLREIVYDTSNIVTMRRISSTILDTISDTGLYTKKISDVVNLSGNYSSWAVDGNLDQTNYKVFYTTTMPIPTAKGGLGTYKALKYDGKILAQINSYNLYSDFMFIPNPATVIVLGASDIDTGWLEAWTNITSFTGLTWGGLIKAYLNGWKLTTANVSVANCVWTGIASGNVKDKGAVDYTYITTSIDTGFQPYQLYYQLNVDVTTQLILKSSFSNSLKIASFPYEN